MARINHYRNYLIRYTHEIQEQPNPSSKEMIMQQYRGKVNAPEFPAGLDWINTEAPLTMAQLRGKIVLLEFWTFC